MTLPSLVPAPFRNVPAISKVIAFVRLSRPHFLAGGVLMFALGAASADTISISRYLLGQLMVSCGQLTAHYVNEYADLDADRRVGRRTWFSGGSGVLVDGSLTPAVARGAAAATTTATAVLAGGLASLGHVETAIIGMLALLICWAYSMPPVRLLATGWGELATTVVVVVLVPWIGVSVQGSGMTAQLLWAIAGLFPVHMAMMLAFEVPDLESDAAAGKMVLAARMGRGRTIGAIAVSYLMAAVILGVALRSRVVPNAVVTAFAHVIPGAFAVRALRAERYNLSGGAALLAVGVMGLAFLVAYL